MRLVYTFVVLTFAVATIGCSSYTVNHDWDRDADFAAYATYGWMPAATGTSGDARAAVERNSLLDKRIRSAVNSALNAKGMRQQDDDPDLVVVYHTGVEDKITVTDWGYRYSYDYYGWGGRDIDVQNYQEGTLIIDLIDTKTMELVWRGSVTGTIDQTAKPEKREKRLKEAIGKVMASYPPSRRS